MKKRNLAKYGLLLVVSAATLIGCGQTNDSGADVPESASKQGGYNSSIEQAYEEGYGDGYQAGYSSGYKVGNNDGHGNGHSQGYSEGYSIGYGEGNVDGYSRGIEDGEEVGYDQGFIDGRLENAVQLSIHSNIQNEYINNGDRYKILPDGVAGNAERSRPESVSFTIPDSIFYNKSDVNRYTLRLSASRDMTDYSEYTSTTGDFNFMVTENFKIGTFYYYYAVAETTSGNFTTDVREIYIKREAPRNLYISGVTNARDMGGWLTNSYKYTPQGLVYRMAALHNGNNATITADGIANFQKLGIKTEIDLRYENLTVPARTESVVPGVAYVSTPIHYEKSLFDDEDNQANWKDAFKVYADASNYPIMFHCAIGTDRTGFMAFILNALAGVKEEGLYRDYLFSNFGNIGGSRDSSTIKSYINTLGNTYGGAVDLSLGARNYLLDIGLTSDEIDNIQNYVSGAVNPLEVEP